MAFCFVHLWFWFVFRLSTLSLGIYLSVTSVFKIFLLFFYFRDFVKAFIQFKKPIVVAINGPALGLGASILPLCDIVWASEKAWFQTPYATIRLTPAGCSSYTFPQILGVALVRFSTSNCRRTFLKFMLFFLPLKSKTENNCFSWLPWMQMKPVGSSCNPYQFLITKWPQNSIYYTCCVQKRLNTDWRSKDCQDHGRKAKKCTSRIMLQSTCLYCVRIVQ